MAATGATMLRDIEGLSAMGLVEILHKIPAHIRLHRSLCRGFREQRWDLVITVDYPGFHLRVAEAARRHGVPVLHYIAPQLWAWHPERAARWAAAVDRLAVILPFEQEFFGRHGIDASYVGHPLVDRGAPPDRGDARTRLGIAADERVLALFPGSRRGEIDRLWPIYRDTARDLLQRRRVDRVVVAGTTWGSYPGAEAMMVQRDDAGAVLAVADAVLAKSGTTTLEAALAGIPMVVGYRIHPLTYRLARRLVTVPWVSLVNLIADRQVVPELMQQQVTVSSLVAHMEPLLAPGSPEAAAQRHGFAEVRQRLGGAGASNRVADLALELAT
jgi:lipid-A-disaccharide synthase